MRPTTAIVLLVTVLLILLASHLHDEALRYDVIMAGAGSGGSQEESGSTGITGYPVDHKTGRVWLLAGVNKIPIEELARTKKP